MSAAYILWLRQLKRYYRSWSRLAGSLGQPLLFLLAFGFGFGPVFQRAGQGNYLQFLVPGIIAMSVMFTSVFNGIEIIWDKQFGFLKETLVAPASRFQIILGRILGGATVAMFQGLIVLGVSVIFGFRPELTLAAFAAIVFMFFIAILFAALGTAIASVLDDIQGFQLVINFLVQPLFFLSGALFPLIGLPALFATVISFNPLSYGVDGLRGSLVGGFQFNVVTDAVVVAGVALILLFIGSFLFTRMEA
jgi:ABC-2 type transport system permease protein